MEAVMKLISLAAASKDAKETVFPSLLISWLK